MLESTGERLVPHLQRGELIYAEHLARYLLASNLAAGKRVLDAGCGEGYGAALLAAAGAASVVGVDVGEPTIEHARERYGGEFRVADVAELPFDAGSFDLVVCFETIEHVANASEAVSELRRVLADDGVLVISTPNPAEYVVENEFHVREYTPAEFAELLDEHFPERTWLYQHNWLLSAILDEEQFRADEETPLELEIRKTASLEPGRELYAVVVCGRPGSAPTLVGVASGVYEAHELVATVRAAATTHAALQERSEIAERERDGWELRATTAERQRDGWELRATTAERQREGWEERAFEAERQVGEAREQLARTEEAHQRSEETIQNLVGSLSWRITRPLRWIGAHIPFS
jgi:2-polyprenyl-3-methyl-5-hydroxy-6-metoxy-1,4-benzoquinol methylase